MPSWQDVSDCALCHVRDKGIVRSWGNQRLQHPAALSGSSRLPLHCGSVAEHFYFPISILSSRTPAFEFLWCSDRFMGPYYTFTRQRVGVGLFLYLSASVLLLHLVYSAIFKTSQFIYRETVQYGRKTGARHYQTCTNCFFILIFLVWWQVKTSWNFNSEKFSHVPGAIKQPPANISSEFFPHWSCWCSNHFKGLMLAIHAKTVCQNINPEALT